MADYSHLKKLDVNEQTTAEYIFEDIPGEPSIIFAPMTASNPDYLNERVRIAVERAEADQAEDGEGEGGPEKGVFVLHGPAAHGAAGSSETDNCGSANRQA